MLLGNFVYFPEGLRGFSEYIFDKIFISSDVEVSSKMTNRLWHPELFNECDLLFKPFNIIPKKFVVSLFQLHETDGKYLTRIIVSETLN